MNAVQDKFHYASRIQDISDEFLGFISMELPAECPRISKEIKACVEGLLDFEKPKVLVYGIYNSGKSTLINALMRKEVAKMADRPETSMISEYDRGEYILVDSPGVDAPAEHEAITNEFLDKCHILLFVISSKGGFESNKNYKSMVELIQRDIPFVIVLNDRGYSNNPMPFVGNKMAANPVEEHQRNLKEIQYKIIENLIRYTGNQNITDQYEVVVLNAKKALTGVTRNKPKLYESSGVSFLDQRIVQLIKTGAALQVLRQPISNLKKSMDDAETCIMREMQTDKSWVQLVKTLQQKQATMEETLPMKIRGTAEARINDIARFYVAGNANAAESIMLEIAQAAENYYAAEMVELMDYAREKCRGLAGIDEVTNLELTRELFCDVEEKDRSDRNVTPDEIPDDSGTEKRTAMQRLLDLFKSKERRREEQLQREADQANRRNEARAAEQMRVKQKARQLAESDVTELTSQILTSVKNEIHSRVEAIVHLIQAADCENQRLQETGQRRLKELREIRAKLREVESDMQ